MRLFPPLGDFPFRVGVIAFLRQYKPVQSIVFHSASRSCPLSARLGTQA